MMHRLIYLVLAASATIVTLLLTTLPGDTSLVLSSSRAIGGTDLTDAFGHVVLFAVLTILWNRAIGVFMNSRAAFVVTILAVLALAVVTEAAQRYIPERGADIFDLAANVLGIILAIVYLQWRDRFQRDNV